MHDCIAESLLITGNLSDFFEALLPMLFLLFYTFYLGLASFAINIFLFSSSFFSFSFSRSRMLTFWLIVGWCTVLLRFWPAWLWTTLNALGLLWKLFEVCWAGLLWLFFLTRKLLALALFLTSLSISCLLTAKTGNLPLAASACDVIIGMYSGANFLRKSRVL